jgi:3-methyladenine DNA glycosylase AlkC
MNNEDDQNVEEMELNRNFETFDDKPKYDWIELKHKEQLLAHANECIRLQYPWADPVLCKILSDDFYKASLAEVNKADYLQEIQQHLDRLNV